MHDESIAERIVDIWLAIMLFVITLVFTLIPFSLSFCFVYLSHSWWWMLFNLVYLLLGPMYLFLWHCFVDYVKNDEAW